MEGVIENAVIVVWFRKNQRMKNNALIMIVPLYEESKRCTNTAVNTVIEI
jgi:hypothetical protein